MEPIRVCVIGGGAAGLCAARHLVAKKPTFVFDVYEQTSQVGGTWVYTERKGKDEHGLPIHSSMYKNLRTNVPKEIMSYLDFPFPNTGKSFIHHTEVRQYLKDYAEKYDINKYIQFRTVVKTVKPKPSADNTTKWLVTVQNLVTKEERTKVYDAVMVCNGHYALPNVPDIHEIGRFQGSIIHSHDYRKPEDMEGLTVVVLGAASSGADICVEVSGHAQQVYLSHNLEEPIVSELPSNVQIVPGVASATEDGFVFRDGSSTKADLLIVCTGYKFDFPFLTPECKITMKDRRITPLYKHLVHMELPSLCFVGIPFVVLPFPLFDYQVEYFIKVINKSLTLPSIEEMEEEVQRDFQKRLDMQMPPRYAHKLGCLQWDYFADLANCTGLPNLPPVVKEIYDESADRRKHFLLTYKNDNYTHMLNSRCDIEL